MKRLMKVRVVPNKDNLANLMLIIIATDCSLLQSTVDLSDIEDDTQQITFDLYIEEEKIPYVQEKAETYGYTITDS